ncbi:hypothetical protein HK097_011356 [Rhizophlyctis rosea]|uniref:Uncharacterized protein n=1 Tax=Rhizophlyctis rosea TaxID=64517 RepID=A0AAD5S6G3_9FUNG|nr:hypothetical protein HK097_011356 [Rhizophlyctis rosea]
MDIARGVVRRRRLDGSDRTDSSLISWHSDHYPSLLKLTPMSYIKMAVEAGHALHANPHIAINCNSCFLFVCAADVGDLAYTKYLLEAGGDLHVHHDEALARACHNGHIKVVQYLISKGADVNVNDYQPLKNACEEGHKEVVRLLLDDGANIISVDTAQQEKIAYKAGKGGSVDIVQIFLEKGINASLLISWCLPSAAEWGHMEVVRFCLNHIIDTQSSSLLHKTTRMAYISRHFHIASCILDMSHYEANTEDLVLAARYGHLPIVERLLRNGVTDDGVALKRAIRKGHLPLAQQKGFSNVVTEYMHYLIQDSSLEGLESYHSGLERAVRIGQTETITVLLRHGLDPNFKSGLLLYIASQQGYDDLVRSLIEYGAVLTTSWGTRSLVTASEGGHLEVVQVLLEGGANGDRDIVEEAGRLAVANGHGEIVRLLRECGADVGGGVLLGL